LLLTAGTLILAGCGSSSGGDTPTSTKATSTKSTATTTPPPAADKPGPERIPLEPGSALAPAATTSPGDQVDGVKCAPVEQLAYHIHAHLQVYVDGRPRSLPGAIGLLGPLPQQTPAGAFYGAVQCYYWLHTHTSDGVIHIESPTVRIYTLGNFFDEWRQPLNGNQVASARGKVTAFLNGRPWTKDPRAIPLKPHALIQLDVGSPVVSFSPISWAGSGL
jgi:hypothetical protein